MTDDDAREQAARELDERIGIRLAQRGLRRCGCPKRNGEPCHSIIRLETPYCPAHDPDRSERELRELLEYDARERKQAAADAARRDAAYALQLPAKQAQLEELQRQLALHEHYVRDARERREALTQGIVDLARQRAEFRARCTQGALALLDRAQLYLGMQAENMTPEICDLMVRTAAELTNHRREQRLEALDRQEKTSRAAQAWPPTFVERTPAERVAIYRNGSRDPDSDTD
jgi:hypothetical protein